MAEGGDKKHEATPYRRQKAREEGQLARSQDLGSAVVLLGAIGTLMTWGPGILEFLAGFMVRSLTGHDFWDNSTDRSVAWVAGTFWGCLMVLLPLFMAAMAIAWLASWVQIGFLFLPGKLQLNWSHVNPLSGLQRIFSIRNVTRVAFGIAKIMLVAAVASIGLWGRWGIIMNSSSLDAGEVGQLVWTTTIDMCFRTALVLLILAVFDYGFQRWRHEEDLKMTDEEVREEMKMMNGDPQIAARRKAVHRQLLANRMVSSIPKADVVITNPTELAIAIQFDPKTMPAPVVVAKGSGSVAARIRKIALEHGVPVLERKPLAQALFKSVEVGQIIPLEQYNAVAEVLRYVYQLQGKKLPDVAA
ncbi:MAG: EscU/YscU/HrcU family type III secretion system export apparatus switch protein [Pirellulaceae bacterium]|nr:EscU/YscU/HrcU family type III secretion system export apparatus switch protein [Pirellulaceae bacterium]